MPWSCVLQTWSAPSWSTILCGQGVESTGVTGNEWRPVWQGSDETITPVSGGTNYQKVHLEMFSVLETCITITLSHSMHDLLHVAFLDGWPFPCIFQSLKSQDTSIHTASFYDWNWLKYMANRGAPGSVDNDKVSYNLLASASIHMQSNVEVVLAYYSTALWPLTCTLCVTQCWPWKQQITFGSWCMPQRGHTPLCTLATWTSQATHSGGAMTCMPVQCPLQTGRFGHFLF